MDTLFLLFAVLLIFITVLVGRVDIKIKASAEEIHARIDFTLIALEFTKKLKERDNPARAFSAHILDSAEPSIKAARYFLRESDIVFHRLVLSRIPDGFNQLLRQIGSFLSISIVMIYLKARAKSVTYLSGAPTLLCLDKKRKDTTYLDVIASLSVYRLIISLLIFLYYNCKMKIKRGVKNARKQNERDNKGIS